MSSESAGKGPGSSKEKRRELKKQIATENSDSSRSEERYVNCVVLL